MKKPILKMALMGFAVAGILAACDSPSKKVEHAQENLSEAKQELSQAQKDSAMDYENFRNASEIRINENELLIKSYRTRMKTENKKWKAEDQKFVDNLEQKNINMRKKIEEFKENGKDKWLDFKVEFSHDMDELGKAVKDLTVRNTK